MKHEIKAMLINEKGAIVNTSSAAGILGGPMMSVYTAAKHGIVGLTKRPPLSTLVRVFA